LPRLIIGNSATPTNNHIDAIRFLADNKINAELIIPLSYGDASYIKYLKENISFYKGGPVRFMEERLSFADYLNFLNSADALVMNNTRPQGYGNIFMMLYLCKPVFLNDKNVSLLDLTKNNIPWYSLQELKSFSMNTLTTAEQKKSLVELLSHDRSLEIYSRLFS
jgi:hypothetical protein